MQWTIDKILSAQKLEDVLSVDDFKNDFNKIMRQVHPDTCSLPGAGDAASRLNKWKDYLENGQEYRDDVGTFRSNGYWADFKSDSENLHWSVENYRLFMQLTEPADRNFKRYLPKECKLLADGTYRYEFENRAIPLAGLTLPQEHVNWVLSRILEYCAYLVQTNFAHCGLTPQSVFIVPETHGIQVVSWYHLTRLGKSVGTISGQYANWYPACLFSDKKATASTDTDMAKRMAAYLSGEPSGNAVRLRKTHNQDFINFLLSSHDSSYKCLYDYRAMLEKNFKKQFHLLTI